MILSLKNSFDSRKTYNGEYLTIPYIGTYEQIDQYSGIFIYVNTQFDDEIRVFYDNINYSNDKVIKIFYYNIMYYNIII